MSSAAVVTGALRFKDLPFSNHNQLIRHASNPYPDDPDEIVTQAILNFG